MKNKLVKSHGDMWHLDQASSSVPHPEAPPIRGSSSTPLQANRLSKSTVHERLYSDSKFYHFLSNRTLRAPCIGQTQGSCAIPDIRLSQFFVPGSVKFRYNVRISLLHFRSNPLESHTEMLQSCVLQSETARYG
jgi:hypothetical protein